MRPEHTKRTKGFSVYRFNKKSIFFDAAAEEILHYQLIAKNLSQKVLFVAFVGYFVANQEDWLLVVISNRPIVYSMYKAYIKQNFNSPKPIYIFKLLFYWVK